MKTDLDARIADLATRPADHALGNLERDIGRDILRLRQQDQALRALAPARALALGAAMAIGAFAGGAMAASAIRAEPPGAFAASSALAPSTLLEGA